MRIEQIPWDDASDPECKNGDDVVLVQYGQAEFAKYVSPKPKGTPDGGGDFIFEMIDAEEDLEEEVFRAIAVQFPQIKQDTNKPLLFLCPAEFACRIRR